MERTEESPGGERVAKEEVMECLETAAVPAPTDGWERIYVASQWQLMWWRFRKHHLAMAAGLIVLCFYLVAIFADVLATTDPELSDAKRSLMPPQRIHGFDGWSLQPHVYPVKRARHRTTFKRVYQVDPTQKIPVYVFARGFTYTVFGLIPT